MQEPARQKTLDGAISRVVILLMALGTVMIFSASASLSRGIDFRRFYNASCLRQIVFLPTAILIMYAVSRIDYRRFSFRNGLLRSPTTWLFAASVGFLVIVLIPGLGTEVNSARRWLRLPLGPAEISFQPSELAKWSLVFFLAAFCGRFADSMKLFWRRFVPACLLTGLIVALIVTQDFGTGAFISLLAFLLLLVGGACWYHFLAPAPALAAAFYLAVATSPTRVQRILAFLNPAEWADSTGYQAGQSLIALATGGLWGKGLGLGVCKFGHLPEDTSDFIFAVIGEEFGFVGTAGVISLFAAFVLIGILLVARCENPFGRLLATGIVLTISLQAALNIGVVTVVLPTKGIPLPFVSAGGTSMLLSAAAVGVLMNIAANTPAKYAEAQADG